MFLRKSDFYSKIKEDNLDVILKDSGGSVEITFLTEAILSATAQVRSYLAHYYDVNFLFRPVVAWSNTTAYTVGDFVAYPDVESGAIYTAKTDHNGSQPDTNPNDWDTSDPREDLLKLFTSDIALYHLHSRINPRNIPELRTQRRDEAIEWLKGIKKGDVTPEFPLLEDTTETPKITYSTQPKKDNSW